MSTLDTNPKGFLNSEPGVSDEPLEILEIDLGGPARHQLLVIKRIDHRRAVRIVRGQESPQAERTNNFYNLPCFGLIE